MFRGGASTPETLGDGRYVVHGLLGEGAQGTTFDAVDEAGRRVAIKRFDIRGAKEWKDVELAEREIRVLATLDHPLVPRYIEHFEDSAGQLYLVMEKVDGQTLDAVRQREGALAESEVRRFLACADRALTYLHGRAAPVVHRDIKPRNVVKRPDGSYVFVDFGAVRELINRRTSNTVVGTFGYMAPEQFQGRASPATDVYAVGATALAALTGIEPDTLPHRGLRVDVRAALAERASEDMIAVLERMLEPDPERRPKSVAAALDAVFSSGARANPGTTAPPLATPAFRNTAREDAQVKSVRHLLFVLWGLGWIIVPAALQPLHLQRLIPFVMFSALAAIFVLIWHKGALTRAILRRALAGKAGAEIARATAPQIDSAPIRKRVEIDGDKVRVHAAELEPDEATSNTNVHPTEPLRRMTR